MSMLCSILAKAANYFNQRMSVWVSVCGHAGIFIYMDVFPKGDGWGIVNEWWSTERASRLFRSERSLSAWESAALKPDQSHELSCNRWWNLTCLLPPSLPPSVLWLSKCNCHFSSFLIRHSITFPSLHCNIDFLDASHWHGLLKYNDTKYHQCNYFISVDWCQIGPVSCHISALVSVRWLPSGHEEAFAAELSRFPRVWE